MKNHLVLSVHSLLSNIGIPYAICGGFGIELFLNKSIREHSDIDVAVFWEDKNLLIGYMQELGWDVYELCGDGLLHKINDVSDQKKLDANLFCHLHSDAITLYPADEQDYYYLDINRIGQQDFDSIEFFVNSTLDGYFVYAQNTAIKRAYAKAILYRGEIPYLAPEIILLYKSVEIKRFGFQDDFEHSLLHMNLMQIEWLRTALTMQNPNGHPWITTLVEFGF